MANQNPSVFLLRILVILGIPLVVGVGVYCLLHNVFEVPAQPGSTEKILVAATPNRNFKTLCQDIAAHGIVRSGKALQVLAKIKGEKIEIKAGEYELSPGMTPREVLAKLGSGAPFKRSIEIKAGMSIREIGRVFEESQLATKGEFDRTAFDPNLLVKAGLRTNSFEGYLLPGTYEFPKGTTIKNMIWEIMEAGERLWKQRDYSRRADELGMTRDESLILASIIEAETHRSDLQPTVASVLFNRLKNGMKLQSLATVRYGLNDSKQNLEQEDLKTQTPFNTFMNYGLPPEPICNPSADAINAALNPQDSTFLFYTPDDSGGLVFSRTESEHMEALRKYGNPVK